MQIWFRLRERELEEGRRKETKIRSVVQLRAHMPKFNKFNKGKIHFWKKLYSMFVLFVLFVFFGLSPSYYYLFCGLYVSAVSCNVSCIVVVCGCQTTCKLQQPLACIVYFVMLNNFGQFDFS